MFVLIYIDLQRRKSENSFCETEADYFVYQESDSSKFEFYLNAYISVLKNLYFKIFHKLFVVTDTLLARLACKLHCNIFFNCIHRIERFHRYCSIEKNIIASLLKFAGYINNLEMLPGNIFGLILKNKMAAMGVFSTFSKDFWWPYRAKGIIGIFLITIS